MESLLSISAFGAAVYIVYKVLIHKRPKSDPPPPHNGMYFGDDKMTPREITENNPRFSPEDVKSIGNGRSHVGMYGAIFEVNDTYLSNHREQAPVYSVCRNI